MNFENPSSSLKQALLRNDQSSIILSPGAPPLQHFRESLVQNPDRILGPERTQLGNLALHRKVHCTHLLHATKTNEQ